MTTTPSDLPAVIRTYLAAHTSGEVDAAARTFAPDAEVTDQDEVFTGAERVRGFLEGAGSEFTYTTRVRGAERHDAGRWVVLVRLEGDFPGGVADLRYRFLLSGDLIARLDIAP